MVPPPRAAFDKRNAVARADGDYSAEVRRPAGQLTEFLEHGFQAGRRDVHEHAGRRGSHCPEAMGYAAGGRKRRPRLHQRGRVGLPYWGSGSALDLRRATASRALNSPELAL